MGEDKALLTVGGQTLASRAVALLKPLCATVVVIGPHSRYDSQQLGVEILEDVVEPCGPLGGILTGLRRMDHEYGLFLACDLPMMIPQFLHYLIGAALTEKPEIVVPVDGSGEYQPLCALYSRRCLPAVERCVEGRQLKVSSFYESVGKLRVVGTGEIRRFSPDYRIFANVNTPEDLALLRQAADQA